jgi:hypothetical protein
VETGSHAVEVARSSSEPRIGLFWGLPTRGRHSQLIGLSRPISSVPEIGGFKTLDEGHVDVWPRITQRRPDLLGLPYEHFPRGRVNWRAEDDRFLLLMDRMIMTEEFISFLVSRWNLPWPRVIILADPHYKSSSRHH